MQATTDAERRLLRGSERAVIHHCTSEVGVRIGCQKLDPGDRDERPDLNTLATATALGVTLADALAADPKLVARTPQQPASAPLLSDAELLTLAILLYERSSLASLPPLPSRPYYLPQTG